MVFGYVDALAPRRWRQPLEPPEPITLQAPNAFKLQSLHVLQLMIEILDDPIHTILP